jgi:hypothetical protein
MLARTVTLLGVITAAAALVMAIASIWLMLADPAAVAEAIGGGGRQTLVGALVAVIVEALEQVVRWL